MADDKLTPSESALLIVLMLANREISNTELKDTYHLDLKKPSRDKLNRLGYVKSNEKATPYVHVLDDKGWDRVHQKLDFDGARLPRVTGAALSGLHTMLLERVLGHGQYHRLGEMFRRVEEPEPRDAGRAEQQPVDEDLELRVRKAYAALAPYPGAWLMHTAVRRKLSDVPGEVLDEVFRSLSHAEDVEMMPESNRKALGEEDHRAAVRVGGQVTHLISIGSR